MFSSYAASFDVVASAIRLALGSTLIVAGIMKLTAEADMRAIFAALGLSQEAVGRRLLTAGEVGIGLWLLSGAWVVAALSTTVLLFATFGAVLTRLVRAGYQGGCACFGGDTSGQVTIVQVGRSAILVLAGLVALLHSLIQGHTHIPLWTLPPLVPVLALLLIIVGASGYALVVAMERLIRAEPRYSTRHEE